MIRRLLSILVPICVLAALLAYSQLRQQPLHVSGFLEADEIRVGSRLGGRIQAVQVEEGEQVRTGQVLVELEPFDLLQREQEALETLASLDAQYQSLVSGLRPEEIAQAKARYDQYKARFDLLDAGPRAQEIAAAQARVRLAEAELKLAKQNYDRAAQLYEKQATAKAEFDAASQRLEAAHASVAVRTEELALLEIGTREEEKREARARVEEAMQAWQLAAKGFRSEEIQQAKAARDAAQAALNAIREQKKELQIICPIDGIIEALDLRPGDLVPAGAPVLSVMDRRRLWVRAYVPQNRVGIAVGQKLWVTVDSFGEERFHGEVTFIARQAEFTPSNAQTPDERSKQVFRIKVELEEGLEQLRPGMTADVWLEPVEASP